MVKKYKDQLSAKLDVKIGKVSGVFPRGGSPAVERSGETPMGNYIADLMRAKYKTDFAIQNGGGIRDTFPAKTYVPAATGLVRTGAGPLDVTLGDAFTVFPFPEPYLLRFVHLEVVNDEVYLLLSIFDQPFRKCHKQTGIQCSPIHHEPHIPSVGDACNERYMALSCRESDGWSLALWRITSSVKGGKRHPALISPVYFSTLFLRFGFDLRVFNLQPLFDFLFVLLVRIFRRSLRSQSPSVSVFAHRL